jgi:hypothetical protein
MKNYEQVKKMMYQISSAFQTGVKMQKNLGDELTSDEQSALRMALTALSDATRALLALRWPDDDGEVEE